jgi:hypothetical protein
MQLGSTAHRDLFCQSFMASYLDYEPEQLPFPQLDSDQLALLKGIPFWEKARDTEREAGVLVSAFAETITDPVIRDAVALQGREEARHAKLIKTLIDRYGIEVGQPPVIELPPQIEKAFTVFGFEECLDSFFAFGLFGIAREAALLPEALFTIFDPILDEEARHIVFFVNWFTYSQIQNGRGFLPLRAGKTSWGYSRALRNLISAFTGSDDDGAGFTATNADAFSLDVTPEQFVLTCLEENRKRMSKFDSRLLQPKLLPRLSHVALQMLRLMPKPKPQNPNLERA